MAAGPYLQRAVSHEAPTHFTRALLPSQGNQRQQAPEQNLKTRNRLRHTPGSLSDTVPGTVQASSASNGNDSTNDSDSTEISS